MLCLPGFFPVIEDTNAGGVSGGIVDVRVPTAPEAASRAKFGRRPSAIHGVRTRKLPPSMPMATALRFVLSDIKPEIYHRSTGVHTPSSSSPSSGRARRRLAFTAPYHCDGSDR